MLSTKDDEERQQANLEKRKERGKAKHSLSQGPSSREGREGDDIKVVDEGWFVLQGKRTPPLKSEAWNYEKKNSSENRSLHQIKGEGKNFPVEPSMQGGGSTENGGIFQNTPLSGGAKKRNTNTSFKRQDKKKKKTVEKKWNSLSTNNKKVLCRKCTGLALQRGGFGRAGAGGMGDCGREKFQGGDPHFQGKG